MAGTPEPQPSLPDKVREAEGKRARFRASLLPWCCPGVCTLAHPQGWGRPCAGGDVQGQPPWSTAGRQVFSHTPYPCPLTAQGTATQWSLRSSLGEEGDLPDPT